jgi:hypothetical protein
MSGLSAGRPGLPRPFGRAANRPPLHADRLQVATSRGPSGTQPIDQTRVGPHRSQELILVIQRRSMIAREAESIDFDVKASP